MKLQHISKNAWLNKFLVRLDIWSLILLGGKWNNNQNYYIDVWLFSHENSMKDRYQFCCPYILLSFAPLFERSCAMTLRLDHKQNHVSNMVKKIKQLHATKASVLLIQWNNEQTTFKSNNSIKYLWCLSLVWLLCMVG